MKFIIALALLVCVQTCDQSIYAQEKNENHLLWRISGKSMAHPSYLFGTIHLKAKRLFNFPDSLYADIANIDVFSLEINPDSMGSGLSDYLTKVVEEAANDEKKTKKKDKKIKDLLTDDELKILKENLKEYKDLDPEKLTVKQMYLIKDRLTKSRARPDDMPNSMDFFLYKIAKDKNRMIGGLEHIEDQLNLIGQLDMSDADPKKLLDIVKNGADMEDQLQEYYIKNDLDALQKLSAILPEKQEKLLLSNRNKIMLRSMDSIMANHSLFCAVGTLHLPGKQGLISLLREKGYTVEPVICNTYTNGAEYKFKTGEQQWVTLTSEKDGYSIKLPGAASDVDAYGGTVKMKMCLDLLNSRYFIVCHIPKPENSLVSTDAVLDEMAKTMVKKSDDVETKSVAIEGLTGKEYFFVDNDDNHYHLELVGNNSDIYMMMAYSKSWNVRKVDSFFKSFRLIKKAKTVMKEMTFEDAKIAVTAPDCKPTREYTRFEDSTQVQYMYTITDPTIGAYYFVVSNQTTKGYNYVNDTVWMASVRTRFDEKGATVRARKTHYAGYNAEEFETTAFGGMKIKGIMVYCGNRMFKVMAQYPDNSDGVAAADTFINSVRLLPISTEEVREENGGDGQFSAHVPEPFTFVEADRGTEPDTIHPQDKVYQSFDHTGILTYTVTTKRLSKYYWKNEDTTMLKAWLKKYTPVNDSVLSYKYYTENGMHCAESVNMKRMTAALHKIKVVGDGRTRYVLDCTYPLSMKDDKHIAEFFNSFKVLKKDSEPLQPTSSAFFAALHSSDSATRVRATLDADEVYYTADDVKMLLKEVVTAFPDDTGMDNEVASVLLNEIGNYSSDISLKELEHLYNDKRIAERGFQYRVLVIMTDHDDSDAAYRKIKSLLLTSTPRSGYSKQLGNILIQHPALAKQFYPELLQLAGDSICGAMVCKLTEHMIDSGYLSKDYFVSYLSDMIKKSKQVRLRNNYASSTAMVWLLAEFDNAEIYDELRQYQYDSNINVRYEAVCLLVDRMKSPDEHAIDRLAANKLYRLYVYRQLADHHMEDMYPKRYRTQALFAESYATGLGGDDINYTKFGQLGVRSEIYNGKKVKFYLFDMRTDDTNDKPELGIVGPYGDDNKQLLINDDDNLTGVYSEPLDKGNVGNQLKVYLIKKKIEDAPKE